MRQVREAGDGAVELQPHGADRAVPLLADDHLGLAADNTHFRHAIPGIRRAFGRLGALNIILFAEHEHDDVGVLLDGARFAQVGELRALVLAVLHRARELRQGDDRHVQFLGQGLEAGGDLRHLLHAVVALAGAARHQLQVVDDHEAEAVLALEPARAGRQLGDGDAAGLVDVERDGGHFLADLDQRLNSLLVDHAAPDLLRGDAGLLGQDAGGELLGRHFQREEADHGAVVARIVGRQIGALAQRARRERAHVEGDVGGERRLAHRWAAGEDDQVGGLQPAHLAVEAANSVAMPDRSPSRL